MESAGAMGPLRGSETTGLAWREQRTSRVPITSEGHARMENPERRRARSRKTIGYVVHIPAAAGEWCRWSRTCLADEFPHLKWRKPGLKRWQGGPSHSDLGPAPDCRSAYGEGDSSECRGFGRAGGLRVSGVQWSGDR